MIGKKILEYNSKRYRLVNPNNYQFVKNTYYGNFFDIEGEVNFYDYEPVTGSTEILSLGWEQYSGKRADIHCFLIPLKEITVK